MPTAKRRGAAAAAAAAAPSAAATTTAEHLQHHPRAMHEASAASPGLVALHRARFVDWSPSPVVAVAASSSSDGGTALAAAREDGAIELWETEGWSCILVSFVRWHLNRR